MLAPEKVHNRPVKWAFSENMGCSPHFWKNGIKLENPSQQILSRHTKEGRLFYCLELLAGFPPGGTGVNILKDKPSTDALAP